MLPVSLVTAGGLYLLRLVLNISTTLSEAMPLCIEAFISIRPDFVFALFAEQCEQLS